MASADPPVRLVHKVKPVTSVLLVLLVRVVQLAREARLELEAQLAAEGLPGVKVLRESRDL